MAVTVAVDVIGLERVVEQIAGLEERVRQLAPALEISADLLELHVTRTFASQGAWINFRWGPLAQSTMRARERRWGYYRQAPASGVQAASPILVWTGRLRESFRRGGAQHVREISHRGLVWGSLVSYGIFHNSLAPRTRIPRRPMLEFRDPFQQRAILFQPLRLWVQGVPAGAIRTVMLARLGAMPL